jgi:hypothetical protein
MGGVSKIEVIRRTRRRERVVFLRRAGAPWDKIAETIAQEFDRPRYTKAEAYRDAQAVLKQTIKETQQTVEEWREWELNRLDIAQAAIWARVLRGDLAAIDRLLRIIELRAKFTGSFAPVRVAGVDGGPLQVEVVAKVAIEAIVGVVDQLNLPLEQRTAALEHVRQSFIALEGSADDQAG